MTTQDHLTQLEALDLIRLESSQPELRYLFRHALVHDAALGPLLRQDRRRLHLLVAEILERLYAGQEEQFAAELGRH